MTRDEFELIQEAHKKLDIKVLRLQEQQKMLLNQLIGQRVECPTGFGDFISGTIVLCDDGRYVRVRPDNSVRSYTFGPHTLRYVEKGERDESDGTGHYT